MPVRISYDTDHPGIKKRTWLLVYRRNRAILDNARWETLGLRQASETEDDTSRVLAISFPSLAPFVHRHFVRRPASRNKSCVSHLRSSGGGCGRCSVDASAVSDRTRPTDGGGVCRMRTRCWKCPVALTMCIQRFDLRRLFRQSCEGFQLPHTHTHFPHALLTLV